MTVTRPDDVTTFLTFGIPKGTECRRTGNLLTFVGSECSISLEKVEPWNPKLSVSSPLFFSLLPLFLFFFSFILSDLILFYFVLFYFILFHVISLMICKEFAGRGQHGYYKSNIDFLLNCLSIKFKNDSMV